MKTILPLLAAFVCLYKSTFAAPAIQLDGKLDEAAWAQGQIVPGFKTAKGEAAKVDARGKILLDDENLYLGVTCDEPLIHRLAAFPEKRDGAVWTNDSLEIFIAPHARDDAYFHLVFDAAGNIYDAFQRGKKADLARHLSSRVATSRGAAAWTLEAAIPLAELQIFAGRQPKICIARERKPVFEYTAWNGWFHQPATWNRLELPLPSRYIVDVASLDFGECQYGFNQMRVSLGASRAADVKVLLEVRERGAWRVKNTVNFKTLAQGFAHLTLPYRLASGADAVRFRIMDGAQVITSATARLQLPPRIVTAQPEKPYLYSEENSARVKLRLALSAHDRKTHRLMYFVKTPDGKIGAKRTMTNLQAQQSLACDVSAWRSGTGALELQLLNATGHIVERQRLSITKMRGPFSP